MVNFLVLTLFLSLTLSVFLFLWSIKKEKGPVHRYSILTLTITGLATGFLILGWISMDKYFAFGFAP